MSMFGLGTVLLISAVTGKYGVAGAVSAVGSLGYAFTSPRVARAVDSHGQRRVLLPLLTVFAVATALLIAAVELRLPTWAFFVPGAIAGSAMPSLGAMVRARWSVLLAGSPRLHAAFSFESVADELCFIVGPAAVTLLATEVFPASGVGVAAVLCLLGTLWFAAERGTEPAVVRPERPASHGSGTARAAGRAVRGAPAPGLVVLAPVYLLLGAMFVSIDLSTVAFAQHFGHKPLAGFILGTYAFGSATGGIWYGIQAVAGIGARRGSRSALALTVLGVATFWAQPNLITLTCGIYLCGLAIAPTLIAGFSLLEAQARPGRRTEAMSWLSSGIAVGVAAGASVVGFVIDAHGPRFGYAFAALCGAASAATCLAGLAAWLRPACPAGARPGLRGVLGVFAGQGQHLGDVPGRVVVGEDRPGRVAGVPAPAAHSIRAAEGTASSGFMMSGGPGGPNPLIPHSAQVAGMNCIGPQRARAGRAVVGAVAALDLTDRGQHRPGHPRAVLRGRGLEEVQVVGGRARRDVRGNWLLARRHQAVGNQVHHLAALPDNGLDLGHQRGQAGAGRRADQHGEVLRQPQLRGPGEVHDRVRAGHAQRGRLRRTAVAPGSRPTPDRTARQRGAACVPPRPC